MKTILTAIAIITATVTLTNCGFNPSLTGKGLEELQPEEIETYAKKLEESSHVYGAEALRLEQRAATYRLKAQNIEKEGLEIISNLPSRYDLHLASERRQLEDEVARVSARYIELQSEQEHWAEHYEREARTRKAESRRLKSKAEEFRRKAEGN